jgi:hypothetical protein
MSKDDVLGAVGLARRPTTIRWLSGAVAILGAGIRAGAAAALLLAPRRGRELHSTIGGKLGETRGRTPDSTPTVVPA